MTWAPRDTLAPVVRPVLTSSSVLLVLSTLAVVSAQTIDTSEPLVEVIGDVCDPPFADVCPPSPGLPECRASETATSRDRSVTAELVHDGRRLGLEAVHLVIRRAGRTWVRREVGHDGVGCGTLEMYATSFHVEELRVADVLGDRAPEVILRVRGDGPDDALWLCSTGDAPRCVARPVTRARLRFQRPDRVLSGPERYRVDLAH
jgi:hypothetical protein